MPSRRQTLSAAAALFLGSLALMHHDHRVVGRQREQIEAARTQHDALSAQLRQARELSAATAAALGAARQELAGLRAAGATARDDPAASIQVETQAWLSRWRELRTIIAQHPELGIPELGLLPDREWLRVAKTAQLETADQVRKSLATLRDAGKEQFINRLSFALRKYLAANDGQLPPNPTALASYLDAPVDLAIFSRYEQIRTGKARDLPNSTRAVIREKAPIDEDYDGRFGLDANAIRMGGGNNARTWIDDPDGYDGMIRRAQAEFARANQGAKASGLEQLAPFINPPLAPAKLRKLLDLERELKR